MGQLRWEEVNVRCANKKHKLLAIGDIIQLKDDTGIVRRLRSPVIDLLFRICVTPFRLRCLSATVILSPHLRLRYLFLFARTGGVLLPCPVEGFVNSRKTWNR